MCERERNIEREKERQRENEREIDRDKEREREREREKERKQIIASLNNHTERDLMMFLYSFQVAFFFFITLKPRVE